MNPDPDPRRRLEEIDAELEEAMQSLSDTNERIDHVIYDMEHEDSDESE